MHHPRHVWLAIASTLLISACSGQPAPNPTPEKTVAASAGHVTRRARQIHRQYGGVQRLPHPVEDGAERARARHDADAVGTPGERDRHEAAEARWCVDGRRVTDLHGLGRTLGHLVHGEFDPRSEHRPGHLDRGHVHQGDREGKHMAKSRPILPPMPWQVYRNFTDDDLKAIFAYLKTIPPIANHVPDPIIAEPPKAPGK